MLSPRVAPQMIGLGLLEAIPAADILAAVDEADTDGDGISGRPSIVPSPEIGGPALGPFRLQGRCRHSARPVGSSVFGRYGAVDPAASRTLWRLHGGAGRSAGPRPTAKQSDLRDGLEVDQESLDLVTFYARNLGVPERSRVG